MTVSQEHAGLLVRRWRQRRRRSQLDVSIAAGVSTRHLSWVETGRAQPSGGMIERLCDELDVPLRERNALHLAAGLAPVHPERPLADLGVARDAINAILRGHDPNPSVAINSRWDLLAANHAMERLLLDVPPSLAGPPLNMLRVTLHPQGMGGRLANPGAWRANVVRRVRRQLERTADPELAELLVELESYPFVEDDEGPGPADDIATPMRMRTEAGELSLLYAVTLFGLPKDVTLDEVAIETFFPADDATRAALASLASP